MESAIMILLLEIINFQFRLFNLYTSILYLVLYMKFIIYEELGSSSIKN